MNTVEAADYLGLAPATLQNYRSKGHVGPAGPPFRRVCAYLGRAKGRGSGRPRIVYNSRDLDRWKRERDTPCPTCGRSR